jgi:hypothetical protein
MLSEVERARRVQILVDDYGGISPPVEAFYIHSIIYAADRTEAAFQRFDDALPTGNAEPVVSSIQEALSHAAGISRFLWPMRDTKLARARGQKLREAFRVDDSSPLQHRKLRNAFEHFDEDLDAFLLENDVGYFFPGALVASHELANDEMGNIFKLVDPKHSICVLLGEKYEFGHIRQEVNRIHEAALDMDASGGRLIQPTRKRKS